MDNIFIENLSSHGNLSCFFHFSGNFFWHNFLKLLVRETLYIGSHSNQLDCLGVDNIVCEYPGKLWEMPRVPLFESHGIVIQFLVKILKKGDCLDNHSVHLV